MKWGMPHVRTCIRLYNFMLCRLEQPASQVTSDMHSRIASVDAAAKALKT